MRYCSPFSLSIFTTFSVAVVFYLPIATVAFATTQPHSNSKLQQHLYHVNYNTKRFATANEEKEKETVETENLMSTNEEFKPRTWNPLRLLVLKMGFTELKFTSPLNYEKRDGLYNCAYCGLDLFDSDGKYEPNSGWPSFWRSKEDGHVKYKKEWDGRLEAKCGRCDSHLGHVFLDGPLPSKVEKDLLEKAPASDPRGQRTNGYLPRFCMNGSSLRFQSVDEKK
jgi:peptide-methionine (R)-S-oxide reductase